MARLEYDDFMEICKTCDIQPNRLFGCLRKSTGISQAKLAYFIDKEGINQNAISKYEHKNNISAEHEYTLWSYLLGYLKQKYSLRRKTDKMTYCALILNTFNLYILKYATSKQILDITALIAEAYHDAMK